MKRHFMRFEVILLAVFLVCVVSLTVLAQSDLTNLPLGDGRVTLDTPQVGYVYSCTSPNSNAGGAFHDGEWIRDDGTWDLTAKTAVVNGQVDWQSEFAITLEGATRVISSNGLPNHPTGVYPVASNDDAYSYDRNPNMIQAQDDVFNLPANPQLAETPSCLNMGTVGIMLTGAVFFNALDGPGRDAAAHEIQDACDGHPESTGEYHYHNLSPCVETDHVEGEHSALVGYALDGFGIYGLYGEEGVLLTNEDLDECHGHTHEIEWDGNVVEMYHYHATQEYPYTVGCYRGTPLEVAQNRQPGGQGQPGGQQPPRNGQQQPPAGGAGGNPPPGGNGNPPPPRPGG